MTCHVSIVDPVSYTVFFSMKLHFDLSDRFWHFANNLSGIAPSTLGSRGGVALFPN